jgi:ferrous iron transport protein B
MWERGSLYLRKAGTIILAAAIIIWLISSFNQSGYIVESTREIDNSTLVADGTVEGNGTFTGEGVFSGIVLENLTFYNGTILIEGDLVNNLELTDEYNLTGDGRFEGNVKFKGSGFYKGDDFVIEESFAADIGRIFEPITKPLGFNWKINTALIFGFAAKEFVVGSLGILYGVGEGGSEGSELSDALRDSGDFSPLIAFCVMLFVLIYTPCIATVAIIKKETGSWRWTIFSVVYGLLLAWITVFIIYHSAMAMGFS